MERYQDQFCSSDVLKNEKRGLPFAREFRMLYMDKPHACDTSKG